MTASEQRGVPAEPVEAPPVYHFPKSADGLLAWSFVDERMGRSRNYWLATTRPDGRPHVTPVWGIWLDGALWFDGLPTTRWGKNLAVNSTAAVHLESGDEVVILEGVVDDAVTNAELGERLVAAWREKYGRLMPHPATDGMFRFRPTSARAWSTASLEDGTRWRFAAAGND